MSGESIDPNNLTPEMRLRTTSSVQQSITPSAMDVMGTYDDIQNKKQVKTDAEIAAEIAAQKEVELKLAEEERKRVLREKFEKEKEKYLEKIKAELKNEKISAEDKKQYEMELESFGPAPESYGGDTNTTASDMWRAMSTYQQNKIRTAVKILDNAGFSSDEKTTILSPMQSTADVININASGIYSGGWGQSKSQGFDSKGNPISVSTLTDQIKNIADTMRGDASKTQIDNTISRFVTEKTGLTPSMSNPASDIAYRWDTSTKTLKLANDKPTSDNVLSAITAQVALKSKSPTETRDVALKLVDNQQFLSDLKDKGIVEAVNTNIDAAFLEDRKEKSEVIKWNRDYADRLGLPKAKDIDEVREISRLAKIDFQSRTTGYDFSKDKRYKDILKQVAVKKSTSDPDAVRGMYEKRADNLILFQENLPKLQEKIKEFGLDGKYGEDFQSSFNKLDESKQKELMGIYNKIPRGYIEEYNTRMGVDQERSIPSTEIYPNVRVLGLYDIYASDDLKSRISRISTGISPNTKEEMEYIKKEMSKNNFYQKTNPETGNTYANDIIEGLNTIYSKDDFLTRIENNDSNVAKGIKFLYDIGGSLKKYETKDNDVLHISSILQYPMEFLESYDIITSGKVVPSMTGGGKYDVTTGEDTGTVKRYPIPTTSKLEKTEEFYANLERPDMYVGQWYGSKMESYKNILESISTKATGLPYLGTFAYGASMPIIAPPAIALTLTNIGTSAIIESDAKQIPKGVAGFAGSLVGSVSKGLAEDPIRTTAELSGMFFGGEVTSRLPRKVGVAEYELPTGYKSPERVTMRLNENEYYDWMEKFKEENPYAQLKIISQSETTPKLYSDELSKVEIQYTKGDILQTVAIVADKNGYKDWITKFKEENPSVDIKILSETEIKPRFGTNPEEKSTIEMEIQKPIMTSYSGIYYDSAKNIQIPMAPKGSGGFGSTYFGKKPIFGMRFDEGSRLPAKISVGEQAPGEVFSDLTINPGSYDLTKMTRPEHTTHLVKTFEKQLSQEAIDSVIGTLISRDTAYSIWNRQVPLEKYGTISPSRMTKQSFSEIVEYANAHKEDISGYGSTVGSVYMGKYGRQTLGDYDALMETVRLPQLAEDMLKIVAKNDFPGSRIEKYNIVEDGKNVGSTWTVFDRSGQEVLRMKHTKSSLTGTRIIAEKFENGVNQGHVLDLHPHESAGSAYSTKVPGYEVGTIPFNDLLYGKSTLSGYPSISIKDGIKGKISKVEYSRAKDLADIALMERKMAADAYVSTTIPPSRAIELEKASEIAKRDLYELKNKEAIKLFEEAENPLETTEVKVQKELIQRGLKTRFLPGAALQDVIVDSSGKISMRERTPDISKSDESDANFIKQKIESRLIKMSKYFNKKYETTTTPTYYLEKTPSGVETTSELVSPKIFAKPTISEADWEYTGKGIQDTTRTRPVVTTNGISPGTSITPTKDYTRQNYAIGLSEYIQGSVTNPNTPLESPTKVYYTQYGVGKSTIKTPVNYIKPITQIAEKYSLQTYVPTESKTNYMKQPSLGDGRTQYGMGKGSKYGLPVKVYKPSPSEVYNPELPSDYNLTSGYTSDYTPENPYTPQMPPTGYELKVESPGLKQKQWKYPIIWGEEKPDVEKKKKKYPILLRRDVAHPIKSGEWMLSMKSDVTKKLYRKSEGKIIQVTVVNPKKVDVAKYAAEPGGFYRMEGKKKYIIAKGSPNILNTKVVKQINRGTININNSIKPSTVGNKKTVGFEQKLNKMIKKIGGK